MFDDPVFIRTGSNYATVSFQNLTIWTSYNTIIGFMTPKTGRVCRQNDWGPTTGKHLNAVQSDKSKRIGGAEFERQLSEVLKSFGLSN
jgi:hypothetical protein